MGTSGNKTPATRSTARRCESGIALSVESWSLSNDLIARNTGSKNFGLRTRKRMSYLNGGPGSLPRTLSILSVPDSPNLIPTETLSCSVSETRATPDNIWRLLSSIDCFRVTNVPTAPMRGSTSRNAPHKSPHWRHPLRSQANSKVAAQRWRSRSISTERWQTGVMPRATSRK